MIPFW